VSERPISAAPPAVLIATFNVNDVNKRLSNLLGWLSARKPDIVCLQELKSSDDAFPADALENAGYGAVWRGQRTWNGVAILARGSTPIVTRTSLPGDADDMQARYIEAAVNGILIASIYLPNGNPQPGPKFAYKLAWFDRLRAHAATLLAANVPVVMAGDFNVVPTDLDIYRTTSWSDDALLHPKSRHAFRSLVSQGWTDALREIHPGEQIFTFWHYVRQKWERNAGLRLDHLLLSPEVARRLEDAGVDRSIRGLDGASDHAPVWITLGNVAKAKRSTRRGAREADAAGHRLPGQVRG
jgi:exodeoxyribonuclease-3